MTRTSTARPAARALIPVLAFTGIVVSMMQTMIIPLIKDLPQLLGTEPRNATWVITLDASLRRRRHASHGPSG